MNAPPLHAAIDTSIVICTCSRAHLLHGALQSLLRQDWAVKHAIEFVIVDDGSADNTRQLLAAVAAETSMPLRILTGPQEGIAAARNLGFDAARGHWIASFDDDQIASPHWLSALRERANREHAPCVGGALTLAFPSGTPDPLPGPRVRSILGEHAPYPIAQPYTPGFQPATNNALIRRDLFLTLKGFDHTFTEGGEDKDLFLRARAAGHTLWFEPAATAQHITPPARLAVGNLHWTSIRLGASDARSALRTGLRPALKLARNRILAAILRDVPRLLTCNATTRLDTRCSLWYTRGLLRGIVALRSSVPAQTAFLRSLNFRTRNGERPEPAQSGSHPSLQP